MSKRKSTKYVEESDDNNQVGVSDDEYIEDKESKKKTNPKKAKKSFDSDYEEGDRGETADGETYFKLNQKKRVTVRKFKNMVLVDFREYFESGDGSLKPTKKGISLQIDQWNKLKELVDDIDEEVRRIK
ncbi:hypothetical protein G9A89_022417 [Geosiphon pyriformis]|nr:hypothetical protein G9A89_022417 [Geosiphon pyriformis]